MCLLFRSIAQKEKAIGISINARIKFCGLEEMLYLSATDYEIKM